MITHINPRSITKKCFLDQHKMEKISPQLAKKIHDLYNQTTPSLEAFRTAFCPDLNEYAGMVLVQLFHVTENNGMYQGNELIRASDLKKFQWETPIDLSRYMGKDIRPKFEDLVVGILEDPYEIWTFSRLEVNVLRDGPLCDALYRTPPPSDGGDALSKKGLSEAEDSSSEGSSSSEEDSEDSEDSESSDSDSD